MTTRTADDFLFRFGDEVFAADIEVVGPVGVPDEVDADCTIRRRRRRPTSRGVHWLPQADDWPDDYKTCQRASGDFELWLGDQAVLRISSCGTSLDYWVHASVDDGYLSHLLLDHGLPNRLGVLGRTAIHGTSVAIDGDAVAFVAPTGVGKSTLAASFVSDGHPLLADDCLLLDTRAERQWVIPTYPATRLLEDSLRHVFGDTCTTPEPASPHYPKRLMGVTSGLATFSVDPHPLRAIVFMCRTPDTSPSIVKVAPHDALERILGQTWYLASGADDLALVLERAAIVVDQTQTLALAIPNDLDALTRCRALVAERLNVDR